MEALLVALRVLFVAIPQAELDRLGDFAVTVTGDGYRIDDVAGEGAPLVGVVEVRDGELWLSTGATALRLRGPLAQPRIAGPGYKVWVLGTRRGGDLVADRLGVIAPPELRSR